MTGWWSKWSAIGTVAGPRFVVGCRVSALLALCGLPGTNLGTAPMPAAAGTMHGPARCTGLDPNGFVLGVERGGHRGPDSRGVGPWSFERPVSPAGSTQPA